MKSILSLNGKHLTSGIASHLHHETGPIWDIAQGANMAHINPKYRNTLVSGPNPSLVYTSSHPIISIINNDKDSLKSILSLSGKNEITEIQYLTPAHTIYRANDSGGIKITGDLSFSRMLTSGELEFIYPSTGGNYIGKWIMRATYPDAVNWLDQYINVLAGATQSLDGYALIHNFGGFSFASLGNAVAIITPGVSSPTIAKAINLYGSAVTAIGDDNRYLVIGLNNTGILYSGASTKYRGDDRTTCKVVFYDTISAQFQWEASIPNEIQVERIFNSGNSVYVVGRRGIYSVAFGQGAKLIMPLDERYSANHYSRLLESITMSSLVSSNFLDGVIFGTNLMSFSRIDGYDAYKLHAPFVPVVGKQISALLGGTDGKLFVGTDTGEIYFYDSYNIGAANIEWKTRPIDLGDEYHIKRINVTLPYGVGSSDDIRIKLYNSNGIELSDEQKIDYAKYKDKTYVSLYLNKQLTSREVVIGIKYVAGTPCINNLEFYGEASPI